MTPSSGSFAPAPRRAFALDLPPGERAAALARRTVADVLRGCQVVDDEWTYEVLLVSSELVGNAVRHGGQRLGLGLTLHDGDLTIEVSDGSPAVPAPRDAADESGRGLTIITALAEDWGVTQHVDGKTVWARLSAPAAAAGLPAEVDAADRASA